MMLVSSGSQLHTHKDTHTDIYAVSLEEIGSDKVVLWNSQHVRRSKKEGFIAREIQ